MLILKSTPKVIKMIPLSKEEADHFNEAVINNQEVNIKGMLLDRKTFIAVGTFMHPNTGFIMSLVHGTNVPKIVVDPLGRIISSAPKKYWWDYMNDAPSYFMSPRQSLITAYKAINTKYALFVQPKLIKIEQT